MATTPKASVPTAATNARAKPFCLHGAAVNVSDNGKSLGIHGKLQVMPTGHGVQGNGLPLNIEYATRRIERFALQEMARSILREMIERNGKMTYVHQVRNCLRAKITKKKA